MYSFKKNNDLRSEVDSFESQLEDLKGPTEAYEEKDFSSQITELDERITEQNNQISDLNNRLDDAESNIKKNSDKIYDFCLIKDICI